MLTTVMSQYMGLLSYLILSAIAFLVVIPQTLSWDGVRKSWDFMQRWE